MKKMKMYLVMLVVSMLLPMRVSAQTVKGKLVDESNHPLPYANVVLLSLPDSAFVSGTISGEDGLFKLEATSVNQIVKISSIGYKTVYKPTTPANMGIVQLVSDARMLGEVVVKANLPVTRIKNDALETNVQGTVLSKAGTAEDVLAHIPGRVYVPIHLQLFRLSRELYPAHWFPEHHSLCVSQANWLLLPLLQASVHPIRAARYPYWQE